MRKSNNQIEDRPMNKNIYAVVTENGEGLTFATEEEALEYLSEGLTVGALRQNGFKLFYSAPLRVQVETSVEVKIASKRGEPV